MTRRNYIGICRSHAGRCRSIEGCASVLSCESYAAALRIYIEIRELYRDALACLSSKPYFVNPKPGRVY